MGANTEAKDVSRNLPKYSTVSQMSDRDEVVDSFREDER